MNVKEFREYMLNNGILMFLSKNKIGDETIVMIIDRFSAEESELDLVYRIENKEDRQKDFATAVIELPMKNTRKRLNDVEFNFNATIEDGSLVLSLESLVDGNQNIRHVILKNKVFNEIYKSNPSLETYIKTRKDFNPRLLTDEEINELLAVIDEDEDDDLTDKDIEEIVDKVLERVDKNPIILRQSVAKIKMKDQYEN